jgi:hypothetical protein
MPSNRSRHALDGWSANGKRQRLRPTTVAVKIAPTPHPPPARSSVHAHAAHPSVGRSPLSRWGGVVDAGRVPDPALARGDIPTGRRPGQGGFGGIRANSGASCQRFGPDTPPADDSRLIFGPSSRLMLARMATWMRPARRVATDDARHVRPRLRFRQGSKPLRARPVASPPEPPLERSVDLLGSQVRMLRPDAGLA